MNTSPLPVGRVAHRVRHLAHAPMAVVPVKARRTDLVPEQ